MITQYMTANKLPRLETFASLCKEPDLSPAYILEVTEHWFRQSPFFNKVADVALSFLQIQCPVLHKEKKRQGVLFVNTENFVYVGIFLKTSALDIENVRKKTTCV